MKIEKRKLKTKIIGLKNWVGEIKSSLESLTSRATADEDRIDELEDELRNTFIQ